MIDEAILREEGMSDFDPYACVPGTKEFLPDFFLDEFDDFTEKQKKIVESQKPNVKAGGVQEVFDKMSKVINEEMVTKMKAIYAFDIKGTQSYKKSGLKLILFQLYFRLLLHVLKLTQIGKMSLLFNFCTF